MAIIGEQRADASFVAALEGANLHPLWDRYQRITPIRPQAHDQPFIWRWRDVEPFLHQAVKEGNLALTVELNAFEWGRLGVDMLDRILKGETVGKQVFIKHRLVDATNVDEVLAQGGKN